MVTNGDNVLGRLTESSFPRLPPHKGVNSHALLQVCTVFAQLTVEGKWQGPHVFVVRIRDNNSQLTPGVKILDNGPKMGLNGVDNGQIWFDHVKVPRDALLDKYASVSAEGVYSSSIKSVAQRFGVTVGGLTTGAWSDALLSSVLCAPKMILMLHLWSMLGVGSATIVLLGSLKSKHH